MGSAFEKVDEENMNHIYRSKLQLIEVNEQGKEQLEQLGVKELFEREIAKLKKKDANLKSKRKRRSYYKSNRSEIQLTRRLKRCPVN